MNLAIKRAIISVSDKTFLLDLAKGLREFGVEIISTGGTYQKLISADIPAKEISQITEFPEMLDGRVKTLHPRIFAGILARKDHPQHLQTLKDHQLLEIDLVVCNLYPFAETLKKPNASEEMIIENIDIGGPSMLRAAAKNFESISVLSSPDQYSKFLEEFHRLKGFISLETRKNLAYAVFQFTACYDAMIANYFLKENQENTLFPIILPKNLIQQNILRYGENPHQQAALYSETVGVPGTLTGAEILHGKELSYNNYLDLNSALQLVREFSSPGAVIVKHNNPCGVGIGENASLAFQRAFQGDPVSAFGGIIALNREVDEVVANEIAQPNRFFECIIAPSFSDAGFEILTTKPSWKKNVRLLRMGQLEPTVKESLEFRQIDGGWLVQTTNSQEPDPALWQLVTNGTGPNEEQLAQLSFAWKVCKHVKSNAIVVAKESRILGVGAGQMSRVDSMQIALQKAGVEAQEAFLASDAFFPFPDNVELAAKAGIRFIVQPGGSMRDQESIDACNRHGISMLFTKMRHFRH